MFKAPDMPDELFEPQYRSLQHEFERCFTPQLAG
jgi:hypothetical protein